jgi:hypothetical protein
MSNRRAWSVALVGAMVVLGTVSGSSTVGATALPASGQTAHVFLPASTTFAKTIDPAKVRDCVNLIEFGAYTHDPAFVAIWNQAGGDATKFRATCEALGRSNPAGLDTLSRQWHDIQKWIAAVAANANHKPQNKPTAQKTPKHSGSCVGGYINVSGNCVPSPSSAPAAAAGATARCNDGTYSHSQHHQGTCSSHGGVAAWL